MAALTGKRHLYQASEGGSYAPDPDADGSDYLHGI